MIAPLKKETVTTKAAMLSLFEQKIRSEKLQRIMLVSLSNPDTPWFGVRRGVNVVAFQFILSTKTSEQNASKPRVTEYFY